MKLPGKITHACGIGPERSDVEFVRSEELWRWWWWCNNLFRRYDWLSGKYGDCLGGKSYYR